MRKCLKIISIKIHVSKNKHNPTTYLFLLNLKENSYLVHFSQSLKQQLSKDGSQKDQGNVLYTTIYQS